MLPGGTWWRTREPDARVSLKFKIVGRAGRTLFMVEACVENGFDCARRHWDVWSCLLGVHGLHGEWWRRDVSDCGELEGTMVRMTRLG